MPCSVGKGKRHSSDAQFANGSEDDSPLSPASDSGLHSDLDYGEGHSPPRKRQHTSEGAVSLPLPSTSRYLPAVFWGSHWLAQESLENIVIFGDSYSKLDDSQTWVVHLGRRLRKQNAEVEVHNFAFPGATAEDHLSKQLSRFFAVFPEKKSHSETPALDPDRTTCIIFLGVNDCGNVDSDPLESIVEVVLDAVHDLYVKAGARNFVLANVPPIDRSPQVMDSGSSGEIEERIKTWNDLLQAQTTEFGTSSKEATVLLFSSHQLLTEVLEDPLEFDFSEEDPTTEGGGIWEDDLHLTTDVHDILAKRLFASMVSYQ